MRSATSWAELLNLFFLLLRIVTLASTSALILYKVITFLARSASQMCFRPVMRMHWAARFSSSGRLQPKSSSKADSVERSGRACWTLPSSALSQVYSADTALVGLQWGPTWQSFPGKGGACAATWTGMRSAQNQDLYFKENYDIIIQILRRRQAEHTFRQPYSSVVSIQLCLFFPLHEQHQYY